MNETDIGSVFLVAFPWDWTIVGRFKGYQGGLMIFDEAGYFTRTGATFDRLTKNGFVPETRFHTCGTMRLRSDSNLVLAWETDWPQRNTR